MVRSETTKERCFIGVLRLPPTLNNRSFISISSNSKAPRGLFVLEHLGRIFTAISISPREGSRQLSSRGSFRAGLNSPDEGLRYHRTVIVTAAVHPGLDSKLTHRIGGITSNFNLRALGRIQLLYLPLRVSRNLCFS